MVYTIVIQMFFRKIHTAGGLYNNNIFLINPSTLMGLLELSELSPGDTTVEPLVSYSLTDDVTNILKVLSAVYTHIYYPVFFPDSDTTLVLFISVALWQ